MIHRVHRRFSNVTVIHRGRSMQAEKQRDCPFCPPEDQRKVDRGYQIDGKPVCQPCFEVYAVAESEANP